MMLAQQSYKPPMDRKAISANLQALATNSSGRPKTALLRDLLEDIEAAFAAGVTHSAVLATLQQQGIEMTLNTFEGTIKRLRAQRLKRGEQGSTLPSSPSPAATATAIPVTPVQAATPTQGSHDPADLDKIFRSIPDMNRYAKIGRERLKKK